VKRYRHGHVGFRELRALARLAELEERSFFSRNPHLVKTYRRRLLLVALCQGAALQYLGNGYGINDFDVHYFYAQNPSKRRLSRSVFRLKNQLVGSFARVHVDFIRTVVPLERGRKGSAAERIRLFLIRRSTGNAKHLAKKAVVGLCPPRLFGRRIWPED
jgi:hypothetical protein